MLSKNRSLVLLIVLAVVVAIYFLVTYTRDNEKNFRTNLDDFDVETVDRIEIYVDDPPGDIFLAKKSGKWIVELPTMELAADNKKAESVLDQLDGTQILNIAANDPSKWEEFNTASEKGTRVKILRDNEVMTDVIIGKFDYIQPKTPPQQNPYRLQQQGEMRSYVRLMGENEVYTINGMIALGIGKKTDDYVDKSLTEFSLDEIKSVAFNYPGGESFNLSQNEGKWFIDTMNTDSALTVKYLRNISNLRGKEVLKTAFEVQNPYAAVSIELAGGNTFKIEAFAIDSASFALRSSSIPQNIVIDDGSLVEKIFVSKDYLTGKDE